jgi:hypothetical protein
MKNTLFFRKSFLFLSFTLLILLNTQLSWGQVTLPHYDGLNYTVGQGLQTQTNWTTLNSGDDLLISSGSLSYTGLPASEGNRVTFAGGGIDAAKLFTQQTSGTVYYSFLMDVTALGSLNATGGYFTGLNEGTASNFGATVWTRLDGAGYDIGINPRTTSANTVWTSGTTSINTTILVVISYQIVAGPTNDIVKLWINPILGGTEPTATLTATNGLTDLVNLNRIFIRQDGTSATPSITMDELRIGTTWESVTPSNIVCTPQTINPITASVTKSFGESHSIATTATSGLAVTYSTSNSGIATVNTDGTVNILGIGGPITLTASQAGNGTTVCAATSVTQTFTVIKATPTISVAPTASGIIYGQTLASSTLTGGTASTTGTFAFTSTSTVPNAGTANQGAVDAMNSVLNLASLAKTKSSCQC